MQLRGVNILLGLRWGELTSDNAAPYFIILSKALSVEVFISGEYPFNSSSS
jgi:hypothetical protein